METYAALRARNGKALRTMFDKAARKGFAAETCSFLRVLEGDDHLPKPDFVVGTSEPCQQGERVLADLVRDLGGLDRYHLLHTPIRHDDSSVESIAAGLEASVAHLERSLGIKMDLGRLKEACALSNEARDLAVRMQPSSLHQSSLDARQRGGIVCDHVLATMGQTGVGRIAADACLTSCRRQKNRWNGRSASTIRIGSYGFISRPSTAAGSWISLN